MYNKSIKKKKLILNSARRVFVDKGYSNVTIKDIIEEADISCDNIYNYFSCVEEIYKSVISQCNSTTNSYSIHKSIDDLFHKLYADLVQVDNESLRVSIEYKLTLL